MEVNMLKLRWSEDLSVNIPMFDEEHKILIEMLDKIGKAIELKDNQKEIAGILDQLTKYAKLHFSHEEEIMLKYLYPDAAEHIRQHEAFIEKIYKITYNYNMLPESSHTKDDDYHLYLEVYNFLAGWFHSHIKKIDKKYTEFLLEAGI